ncbi:MAG: PAS domain-containing protein [Rhodobacteraceae bacterium]|nr:PAS domain-containing protein [Paracoccaceae bacterium]
MTDRSKARQTASLKRIEAYWHSLSDGKIPLRSKVDPKCIEADLEYAFIAEQIAPGMAKLRVAGSHLNDLMGIETSGMPLSALLAPAARPLLSDALIRFFREPGITRIHFDGEQGIGKPALSGEAVLAPLCSDTGDFDRALGGLVTYGKVGRTPRRMTITSLSHVPLDRLDKHQTPQKTQISGFAEPVSSFQPAPKTDGPSKHPYLRLIVSNDD